MASRLRPAVALAIACVAPPTAWASPPSQSSYGIDVSFPVQNGIPPPTTAQNPQLAHRKAFYDGFMERCRAWYGEEDANACDEEEATRMHANLEQPSICVNFTDTGYKKVRAPAGVMELLTRFWTDNFMDEVEESSVGTLINSWDGSAALLSVDNPDMSGSGREIKQAVWDSTRELIQAWTGNTLKGTSLYGIRIYKEGHVLATHVDDLPLVSSAIINVAQDVDEPWPLEVYGRDGMAVNITMEPGDMVLYESHSLLHGRPFPLRGRFYANIFVHFEPAEKPKGDELPIYMRPDADEDMLKSYYYDGLEQNVRAGEEDEDWLETLRKDH